MASKANSFQYLIAMASNRIAISKPNSFQYLIAMASNRIAMACNLIAMVSKPSSFQYLVAMASNLLVMASNMIRFCTKPLQVAVAYEAICSYLAKAQPLSMSLEQRNCSRQLCTHNSMSV